MSDKIENKIKVTRTISEFFNSLESLNKISTRDINLITAFKLKRARKELTEPLTSVQESINEIKKKGNDILSSEGDKKNLDSLSDQIQELLSKELSIEVERLTIDDLKKANGEEIDITGNELISLDWLIEDKGE